MLHRITHASSQIYWKNDVQNEYEKKTEFEEKIETATQRDTENTNGFDLLTADDLMIECN